MFAGSSQDDDLRDELGHEVGIHGAGAHVQLGFEHPHHVERLVQGGSGLIGRFPVFTADGESITTRIRRACSTLSRRCDGVRNGASSIDRTATSISRGGGAGITEI